jgi:hypothetical protein
MTLDEALKEIRAHAEATREEEMLEVELLSITEHIEELITGDQFKSWKLVESLISGESANSSPHIYEDSIRKRLIIIGERG